MSAAVFPGSFDPITVGHLDIIKRAAQVFDTVYVSILDNPGKDSERLSVEDRLELISDAIKDIPNAIAKASSGLSGENINISYSKITVFKYQQWNQYKKDNYYGEESIIF